MLYGRSCPEVVVLGTEPHLPYERPALSKGYLAAASPARLPGFHTCVGGGGERQDANFYAQNGVEFIVGSATGLDTGSRTVLTDLQDTPQISFEYLILATGSSNVTFPGLEKALTLRNIGDADRLITSLENAKSAVVIGAGFIGMEVSAALVSRGLDVSLVFPEDQLMPKLFTKEVSSFYETAFADSGVTLVKNAALPITTPDDGGVIIGGDKKIEADIVVAGTGAKPATSFLSGTKLLDPKTNAVLTDGNLETSVPGIFAIGDLCAFPLSISQADEERRARNGEGPPTSGGGYALTSGEHRFEHVIHARASAAHAVEAILAKEAGAKIPRYYYLPSFYSRFLSYSWTFCGTSEGDTYQFGDIKKGSETFGYIYASGGNVVGAFQEALDSDQATRVRSLVENQANFSSPEDLEKLLGVTPVLKL